MLHTRLVRHTGQVGQVSSTKRAEASSSFILLSNSGLKTAFNELGLKQLAVSEHCIEIISNELDITERIFNEFGNIKLALMKLVF